MHWIRVRRFYCNKCCIPVVCRLMLFSSSSFFFLNERANIERKWDEKESNGVLIQHNHHHHRCYSHTSPVPPYTLTGINPYPNQQTQRVRCQEPLDLLNKMWYQFLHCTMNGTLIEMKIARAKDNCKIFRKTIWHHQKNS